MNLSNQKIIRARASFVHNSPRKIRIVADALRAKKPTEAVVYLKLLPQRSARPLLLVYQQALGNAKSNFQISPGDLVVKSLQIQGGPRGPKKADVHAHGARFDRGIRRKRMSHILLELAQIEEKRTAPQIEEAEIIKEEAPTAEPPKVKKTIRRTKKEAK